MHGPWRWASLYPECGGRNQSPVDILDEEALVSQEYQELALEGFELKSSNKTSMKNTGKTGKTTSDIHLYIPDSGFQLGQWFSRTQRK